MIRLHYVHEEPGYVVRRPNGLPLSFPVWMTQPAAARIEIVREPRLPLTALLELRRLATTYLSSMAPSDSEGGQDAATRGTTGVAIRGRESGSRASTTKGRRTRGHSRARALDDSTRKDNRRGGGQ